MSALERPGAQQLVARPELDSERRGGALAVSWSSILPAGVVRVEAWGGATYDVALRFLAEDPWERLASLREMEAVGAIL